MINFEFCSPTKFVFGRGAEAKVGCLVREFGGTKALLHFGGGWTEYLMRKLNDDYLFRFRRTDAGPRRRRNERQGNEADCARYGINKE